MTTASPPRLADPFDPAEIRRIAEAMLQENPKHWTAGIARQFLTTQQLNMEQYDQVQARFGYVDQRAVPIVAEVLNLSRAEVHGVVTFYHDFRAAPPPRHVVKLCRAEACQAMGADRLADALSASGRADVALEAVYCLGNCALSPAALIDGKLYGRLDRDKALAQLGPQAGRI